MNSRSLAVWLLAIRPKTLTAALIPVIVGTALASSIHGTVQLDLSLFAFLSAIFIQIGTNLFNDAMDFKKGADTAERIGPQRVTQSGLLEANQVAWGGAVCFLIASLLSIPLLLAGGWPIVVIGIASLIAGYAYTGGPFPLAYVGLGDLFVLIFFGWVAVGGIYYLNTGTLDREALLAGTQVGLLSTVLIAINNLRDYQTDRKAGKRTLAVRLGPTLAKVEIAGLCFVPFVLGGYWFQQGLRWATLLPLGVFPFAFFLFRRIQKTDPSVVYNQFLAQSALLHLTFGMLLSLGFYLR